MEVVSAPDCMVLLCDMSIFLLTTLLVGNLGYNEQELNCAPLVGMR
jgi:hypothetical protein